MATNVSDVRKRSGAMRAYDWGMALASLWISGGILYDAWHHFHEDVETFFQPGHAVLYGGLLAAYLFTGMAVTVNRQRGFAWRDAVPRGYGTALAGMAIFTAGGILDLVKHAFFGFEEAFNALVSPTHLVIGAGMFLIIASPLVAALGRVERPRTLLEQVPLLGSAAGLMELIHWGVQFVFVSAAAKTNAPPSLAAFPHDTLTIISLQYYKQGVGLISPIIQALVLMGVAVYLARRVGVARGGYTLLFVLGNIFVGGVYANTGGEFAAVVLASIASGICADSFAIEPRSGERRFALFAFIVPALYWGITLAVLAASMGGLWWTPDIIGGSIVYSGFAGLFINALSSRSGLR